MDGVGAQHVAKDVVTVPPLSQEVSREMVHVVAVPMAGVQPRNLTTVAVVNPVALEEAPVGAFPAEERRGRRIVRAHAMVPSDARPARQCPRPAPIVVWISGPKSASTG